MTNNTLVNRISRENRDIYNPDLNSSQIYAPIRIRDSRHTYNSSIDDVILANRETFSTLGRDAILLNEMIKAKTPVETKASKWDNFKEYAKCVYANKFTLAGYISGVIGTGMLIAGHASAISLFSLEFSFASLLFTGFGTETREAYQATKKHIQRHGIIDNRFLSAFVKNRSDESINYCPYKGILLAAKELGKEKHVKDFYSGIELNYLIVRRKLK